MNFLVILKQQITLDDSHLDERRNPISKLSYYKDSPERELNHYLLHFS